MKNRKQLIVTSLLLAAPLFLFLLRHYAIHSPGLCPTGFTQSDNVVYISNARQHLEQTSFGLTYSNPYSYTANSPSIYSQPINFLFCLLLLGDMDPGLVISVIGLLFAILCIYVMLSLINSLYPNLEKRTIIYILSVWGGGVTALMGLAGNYLFSNGSYAGLEAIHRYDPGEGWWGLNLSRPLFLPMEAFYHFLFITCIFFILKHKWVTSLFLTIILYWSHPFTGIEFAGIILAWLFVEKVLVKNSSVPWTFVATFILIVLMHLYYYLFFLNSYPEHKKLFQQFSINWSYDFKSFVPGYLLVVLLALVTFCKDKLSGVFKTAHQRLFLCWAIVAFLFSKHDWFIPPIQPLHFTRGYIWWGLFLFSIPALQYLQKRFSGKLVTLLFVILFLSDNILWYTSIMLQKHNKENESYVSMQTRQVFDWLQDNTTPNDLLISNEELVSYMASAYASTYSWFGHNYNTPFYRDKKEKAVLFFEKGVMQPEWKGRRLLVLLKKSKAGPSIAQKFSVYRLFENQDYEIFAVTH